MIAVCRSRTTKASLLSQTRYFPYSSATSKNSFFFSFLSPFLMDRSHTTLALSSLGWNTMLSMRNSPVGVRSSPVWTFLASTMLFNSALAQGTLPFTALVIQNSA